MPVILLLGPAGSGKDTAARALADRYGGTVYHLADPIRQVLDTPVWHAMLARQIAAGEHPVWVRRRAMQAVGDSFRALHHHALVDALIAQATQNHTRVVIVPDVRLPEELAQFRACWPQTLTIYCETPDAERRIRLTARDGAPLDGHSSQHVTESAVVTLRDQADWVWRNGATWELAWDRLASWVHPRMDTVLDRS